MTDVLATLEAYYDTAPRASATATEVGPFTLFVRDDPAGWHFYARPRLGLDRAVTVADVHLVRARQRALGVPESLEWVHETTPSLLAASRGSGMTVEECPLLVLDAPVDAPATGATVRTLSADDDLGPVLGAVDAGFAGVDDAGTRPPGRQPAMIREGLLAMAAAYDERGTVVGGGSHGPRGATTELTGIAVLPRARRRGVGAAITAALVGDARARGVRTVFLSAQDDTVARVYERVGFARVGTACTAAPAEPSARVLSGDDWATWRDIRLRALRESPSAFGSTYAREVAHPEARWREELDDPDSVSVLVEAGGRPVGMAGGFPDLPGLLHVVAMWVDPVARGRGVAHLLLRALEDRAAERGLGLHLDVNAANAVARRSYERYGFVGTGENRPLREGSAEVKERMVLTRLSGTPGSR